MVFALYKMDGLPPFFCKSQVVDLVQSLNQEIMNNIKLEDGEIITFETSQNVGAFGTQGVAETVEVNLKKVSTVGAKVLKESIESIKQALDAAKPNELELEIGLSVGVEGSVIVTKSSAEANITIKAKWILK